MDPLVKPEDDDKVGGGGTIVFLSFICYNLFVLVGSQTPHGKHKSFQYKYLSPLLRTTTYYDQ